MADRETNYHKEAESDAASMVQEFEDQIIEQLIDKGEASDDYNNDYDGGDEYHHQSHVDKAYSLLEAANLLDQLDRYEETDSGLWQGLKPREAISAQAAYTYGNAVGDVWRDFIKKINEAFLDFPDTPAGKATRGGKGRVQDWSPAHGKRIKLEELLKKMIGTVLEEGL